MTEGNFVDYVKVHISSGNGGKGSAHLRREKYVAKGGPDGGDGGRGGHVILKGNSNLKSTLKPVTESTEVKAVAQGPMAKMFIWKCH